MKNPEEYLDELIEFRDGNLFPETKILEIFSKIQKESYENGLNNRKKLLDSKSFWSKFWDTYTGKTKKL